MSVHSRSTRYTDHPALFPNSFFSAFPPFPRNDRVFVAMSFADAFTPRWENVLRPAISAVSFGGTPLVPHRVDLRRTGDSILTEILDDLGRARLILADISHTEGDTGAARRNANVMYEVGIAHAVRQPEEVILLRSDNTALPFDVANVRVHTYSPDSDVENARRQISLLLEDALASVELKRNLAIRAALEQIDFTAFDMLVDSTKPSGIRHPFHPEVRAGIGYMGAWPKVNALEKLLSIGAVKARFSRLSPEALQADGPAESLTSFHATEFGVALALRAYDDLGFGSPEVAAFLATPPDPQIVSAPEAETGSQEKPSLLDRLLGLRSRAV